MSSNLTGNSVTTDSITPRTSASTALSVTTTGSVNLSGSRINFGGGTSGFINNDGATCTIAGAGQTLMSMNGISQVVGVRTTSPAYTLDVNGSFSSRERQHNYIMSQAASASATTTNFVTFPSAGVYFLLVSQCSGTSSQTPELIDNLCRVYLCVVSTSSATTQWVQLYSLANNTGWFNCTGSGQYTINLNVNAGTFTYRAFYQKIF